MDFVARIISARSLRGVLECDFVHTFRGRDRRIWLRSSAAEVVAKEEILPEFPEMVAHVCAFRFPKELQQWCREMTAKDLPIVGEGVLIRPVPLDRVPVMSSASAP